MNTQDSRIEDARAIPHLRNLPRDRKAWFENVKKTVAVLFARLDEMHMTIDQLSAERDGLRAAVTRAAERLEKFAKLDKRFALITENGESRWVTMGNLYAEEARVLRETLGGAE